MNDCRNNEEGGERRRREKRTREKKEKEGGRRRRRRRREKSESNLKYDRDRMEHDNQAHQTIKHSKNRDNKDHKRKKQSHSHSRTSDDHRQSSHRKSKRSHKNSAARDIEEDQEDEDDWVEMETTQPEPNSLPVGSDQPTLVLGQDNAGLKPSSQRDSWMLPEDNSANQNRTQGGDYLNSFGTLLSSRATREKADVRLNEQKEDTPQLSSLIKRLGADDPEYRPDIAPTSAHVPFVPGGPGYQWRITKLRRTYDAAKDENRPLEEVALERYGTLEAWEQAKEERRIVEDRHNNPEPDSGRSTPLNHSSSFERRYMYTNSESQSSRPNSRSGFRKPTSALNTPEGGRLGTNKRLDEIRFGSLKSTSSSPSSSVTSTPIPTVINPLANRNSLTSAPNQQPVGTTTLNKLQASILKAKMMNPAAVPELEKQYNEALEAQNRKMEQTEQVEVIPSLDGRGRMYDIGTGVDLDQASSSKPGNKRKKDAKFESRDRKTGEILRFNPDDDEISLSEMVRQEKFQAGAADQKNLDAEMASRIMSDSKFENDLDYMDDNADRLARKKMKTDASKRLFAINDYGRTKKALENCQFCFKDDGGPPANLGIISTGTKVYLTCTQYEELVEGHCWIVPIQHSLSSLELDDDVWDEIKNYMKCLMRMFAEKHDKGVVFYETILSFKHQLHTYIEAVPIPWDLFNDIPAYFRESINSCESEWSQHKKLINFSDRPGGFRRSMVSKLPYFMIQWDYKGEKGFGHVIEGNDDVSSSKRGPQTGEEELNSFVDDGMKGSKFPRYFAAEIIGNLLELEPHKWRKPKRIGRHHAHPTSTRLNQERVKRFLNDLGYSKYDWTGLLS